MPRLSKIARILGPRGLMPNPKLGSVTSDVSGAVKEVKCGRIDFKIDKTAIVHAGFGKKHIDTGADISVSCVPMDDSRASDFGLVKIDETGRIEQFLEKPEGESLKTMQVDTTVLGLSPQDAKKYKYIASMGIYVFRTSTLLRLLRLHYPTANDFGSEVIPKAAKDYNVQAYLFDGYWEDIGTIKSFFDANLSLTYQSPKFHFYDPLKPIITSPQYLPPAKIEKCKVVDSIVSHGCFLTECSVEHSVVGFRSRLDLLIF